MNQKHQYRNSRASSLASRLSLAAGTLALTSGASATWSLILVDMRTGEVAVASATCLTSFDLRDNLPAVVVGQGAACAQSFVDTTTRNRGVLRDGIVRDLDAQSVFNFLSTFDLQHQTRQYGYVTIGGHAGTFSGTGAAQWKGGVTGQVGDIVYAVQGNILTGEPVVDAIEQVILTSTTDLPGTLMLAMEAARAFGGDGRCSCSPSAPTSCGSPPASFTKSADIGFMIVARIGDADGAPGFFFGNPGPNALSITDADGDGRLDAITNSANSPMLFAYLNDTPAQPLLSGRAMTTMQNPTSIPLPLAAKKVAVAPMDADAHDDIVALLSDGSVAVLRGKPKTAGKAEFEAPVVFATGFVGDEIIVRDFTNDGVNDVNVTGYTASKTVVMVNSGAGALAAGNMLSIGGSPKSIAAIDLSGDGTLDLAYTAQAVGSVVMVLNDGAGALSIGPFVIVGGQVQAIASGKFSGSATQDLLVSENTGKTVTLYKQAGASITSVKSITLDAPAPEVRVGDLDSDGDDDFVARTSIQTSDLHPVLSDGAGQLTEMPWGNTGTFMTQIALADVGGDGIIDVVGASQGRGALVAIDANAPGLFQPNINFGGGDYFMNFNVAFQTTASPDPVLQLRDLFDDWRASKVGVTDAITSDAVPPAPTPRIGEAIISVSLTDHLGDAVTTPGLVVTAKHGPKSAGSSVIGTPVEIAPGQWEVPVTITAGTGANDTIRIVVDDGVRPVTLMPDAALDIPCYGDCDGDGELTFFDFLCFQNEFANGQAAADCDADGSLTFFDFLCFQNAFATCD